MSSLLLIFSHQAELVQSSTLYLKYSFGICILYLIHAYFNAKRYELLFCKFGTYKDCCLSDDYLLLACVVSYSSFCSRLEFLRLSAIDPLCLNFQATMGI